MANMETMLAVESASNYIFYRIKRNDQVAYVNISNPDIIPEDSRTYGPSAIAALSKLDAWKDTSWVTLHVHLDEKGLRYEKDTLPPHSVPKDILLDRYPMHDISTLRVLRQIKYRTSEVSYNGKPSILKIARFPYEIRWVIQEIQAYHSLEGSLLAPKLLAYVSESSSSDRVIGFLVEKIEGRYPTTEDLELCQQSLRQLHSFLIHGDLCKYNILITQEGLRFIDLEDSVLIGNKAWSSEGAEKEMQGLLSNLADESGRGRPMED
ncbi:unnamed protein product [Clonostachys rosea f. rosea IK726]|jgi:hypothetical protein|uniref:Uncharacterized protein n=1 Tax=Clonostachys rosea f. rosea IK726 TaxID=1349383 RepID=A0ACA9TWN4_BIOOC|nr:unnamed protein product [Clonostachys rosea f. rosea IK726]